MSYIIDISSNNPHPNGVFDFSACKANDVIGVYIKIGEGIPGANGEICYLNPFAQADAEAAKAAGLLVGFYWFYNTEVPWHRQLLNFKVNLTEFYDQGIGNLIPAIDYEVGTPSPEILTEISSKFSGERPLMYMNEYFYANSDGGMLANPIWFANPSGLGNTHGAALIQITPFRGPDLRDTDRSLVIYLEDILLNYEVQQPIKENMPVTNDFSVNPADAYDEPIQAPAQDNVLDPIAVVVPAETKTAPCVGSWPTKTGGGYWLAYADGGVEAFGDAPYYGSYPDLIAKKGVAKLNYPIATIFSANTGSYILVAEDGGTFEFKEGTV